MASHAPAILYKEDGELERLSILFDQGYCLDWK